MLILLGFYVTSVSEELETLAFHERPTVGEIITEINGVLCNEMTLDSLYDYAKNRQIMTWKMVMPVYVDESAELKV